MGPSPKPGCGCASASEMGPGSIPFPPHCLLPDTWALARSTLAWRPGSAPCRCPCFSPPLPLSLSLPAWPCSCLPPERHGICRRCGPPCLPRPFGCSLTAVDLSQWFSSLIFLLMALHLTESFPPRPPPFIF